MRSRRYSMFVEDGEVKVCSAVLQQLLSVFKNTSNGKTLACHRCRC
jgi:peroxiredoxin